MIGQLNLEQLAVYPALYSHVWLALLAMYYVIINYATKTVVINEKKNLYVICCCHGSYIHRTMNSWLYPHIQVKSILNRKRQNSAMTKK